MTFGTVEWRYVYSYLFVAVHRWNGKEFVEIDIHSLNGIKKGGEGYGIALPRMFGNFLYDKSGMALDSTDGLS